MHSLSLRDLPVAPEVGPRILKFELPIPGGIRLPQALAAFAENVCHGRDRHGPQAHSRAASSRASRPTHWITGSLTPTSTFAPKTLAFSLQGRKLSFEEAWAVSPASAHNFRPSRANQIRVRCSEQKIDDLPA